MLKSTDQAALDRLVNDVLGSAKYRDISPDLVKNIGAQELLKRRSFKEALKSTKNKLHQVSGAYLDRRESYKQWLHKLSVIVQTGNSVALRQECQQIMSHHASTRERLPILDQFYSTLLADLAPIHSVLDIACGLNPLSIPWMPLAPDATYYAYDIHQPMLIFLEDYMKIIGITGQAHACDVLQSCPTQEADVALILKTLPCLEQVDKHSGLRLLHAINANHLIVSFPAHSLGGKSKGMPNYYELHFREMVGSEGWDVKKVEFATELVFVVRKRSKLSNGPINRKL